MSAELIFRQYLRGADIPLWWCLCNENSSYCTQNTKSHSGAPISIKIWTLCVSLRKRTPCDRVKVLRIRRNDWDLVVIRLYIFRNLSSYILSMTYIFTVLFECKDMQNTPNNCYFKTLFHNLNFILIQFKAFCRILQCKLCNLSCKQKEAIKHNKKRTNFSIRDVKWLSNAKTQSPKAIYRNQQNHSPISG